jgi:uroporphyrinogen-III synthase
MRIVLTRPVGVGDDIARTLAAAGADVAHLPAVSIVAPASHDALDVALRELARYDWVALTSANAVRAVVDRAREIRVPLPDSRPRLGAVGSSTADALASAWRAPDVVASVAHAEGLVNAMRIVPGARVLFPASEIARDVLPRLLDIAGAAVDRVEAYRTVPGPGAALAARDLASGAVHAVVFTSPSGVDAVSSELTRLGHAAPEVDTTAICIGPTTARAASDAGWRRVEMANAPDPDSIKDAVLRMVTT